MKPKTILFLVLVIFISNVFPNQLIIDKGRKDSLIIKYEYKAFVLDKKLVQYEYYGYYVELSEEDFIDLISISYLKRMDLLNKYKYKIKDKEYLFIEENRILLKKLYLLNTFEESKRLYTQTPEFKVSTEYPNIFNKIDLNNKILLSNIKNYKYLVFNYYIKETAKITKRDTNKNAYLTFLRILSNDSINNEIKNTITNIHAKRYLKSISDSLQTYYSLYQKINNNKKDKKEIAKIYKQLNNPSKRKKSPNFNFEDINRKSVKLSDFVGSYVYIDIWATWCKPCIIEQKQLHKLVTEFPNIIFISICKSSDKNNWKDLVKNNKLRDIQLFTNNNNNDFFNAFSVKEIPRFILIDKEGRILNSNGPRPSHKNTREILKNLK